MKAIKYLIIGLLVVSVTKKAYMSDFDQRMPFAFTLSPKDAQTAINALGEPSQQSMTGLYDPVTKTATIVFTGVIEYNKSVTPPNVMNRSLKLFGTMPTPGVTSTQGSFIRPGGVRPLTSLYGIAQATSNFSSKSKSSDSSNDQSIEHYDTTSKTAVLKNGQIYVGVIEYNRSVTPPNLSNPALQQFATIATPHYQGASGLSGGLNQRTLLFGLPVSGEKLTVKSGSRNVGFYWQDSKIAQLNNGDTFVCIIQEKQRNYKQAHATGPAYTWFEQKDLAPYGILNTDSDFKQRVENIGTIKLDHATVTLHGVLVAPRSPIEKPQLLTQQQNMLSFNKAMSEQQLSAQNFSNREKANTILDSITNSLGAAANFVRSRQPKG